MTLIKYTVLLLSIICFGQSLSAQKQIQKRSFVDDKGVLRWSNTNEEIHGFGVNYTLPFAHAFKMAKRLGIDPKEAIKQDVYHFARLDLDLYRVHVWDTEISDSIGNLLENEHLELFDFMLYEMKKRGMKFIITPIAFWGNGWPEPDSYTPGFSHKYGKDSCLTNIDAIKAQANYLHQFLEHVNPYTQLPYKDDPDIIAFEISNEPHHKGSAESVTKYINKLVKSMRNTGTQTPIFYNMSHSIDLVDAYLNADIDGGTFQWYPSGLVSKHALKGNFLTHVDNYSIPFSEHPKFKTLAKIVYEFDPADVDGNYMYPAMARSFRKANMQLATHFAYDAMFLAPWNTNYGTHYMNLAYAPQKAISLKVASAVFHHVPMGHNYGSYPQNSNFDDFRINYDEDLVEYVSNECFFYSNNTQSQPKNIERLEEICGFKSSPLIDYNGEGAYFLDRLETGVWRLEVMPDAYWLDDPYEPTSPKKNIASVNHQSQPIEIQLPDLGPNYLVEGINKGNSFITKAKHSSFMVMPGVYILKAKESAYDYNDSQSYKNISLNEYVAPYSNLDTVIVQGKFSNQFTADKSVDINFKIITSEKPKKVNVDLHGEFGYRQLPAILDELGFYKAVFPIELTQQGRVNFYINVELPSKWMNFPSGLKGQSTDWDNYNHLPYTIDFVDKVAPLQLWNAQFDWAFTMYKWNKNIRIKPAPKNGKPVLCYDLYQDAVNTFKFYFKDKIVGRQSDVHAKTKLVLCGKSLNSNVSRIEVSLIDKEGRAYSTTISINSSEDKYEVNLSDFVIAKNAIVPSSFPDFLPYYFDDNRSDGFNLSTIETLQVSVQSSENYELSFYLEKICLE